MNNLQQILKSCYQDLHNQNWMVRRPGNKDQFILVTHFPPLFLHTASDQKLDSGKIWERGYGDSAQLLSTFFVGN